jgi:hypothetical protein
MAYENHSPRHVASTPKRMVNNRAEAISGFFWIFIDFPKGPATTTP